VEGIRKVRAVKERSGKPLPRVGPKKTLGHPATQSAGRQRLFGNSHNSLIFNDLNQ
jgi:hypothetical protein